MTVAAVYLAVDCTNKTGQTIVTCHLCGGTFMDVRNLIEHEEGAKHSKSLRRRLIQHQIPNGIGFAEAAALLRSLKESKSLEAREEVPAKKVPAIQFTTSMELLEQAMKNGELMSLLAACPNMTNDIFCVLEKLVQSTHLVDIRDQLLFAHCVMSTHSPDGTDQTTHLMLNKLEYTRTWSQLVLPYHHDPHFLRTIVNDEAVKSALKPESVATFLWFLRTHPTITVWEAQAVRLLQFGFELDTWPARHSMLDVIGRRAPGGFTSLHLLNRGLPGNHNPWRGLATLHVKQTTMPPKVFRDLLFSLDTRIVLDYSVFVLADFDYSSGETSNSPDVYTSWAEDIEPQTVTTIDVPVSSDLFQAIAFSTNPGWKKMPMCNPTVERRRRQAAHLILSTTIDTMEEQVAMLKLTLSAIENEDEAGPSNVLDYEWMDVDEPSTTQRFITEYQSD